MLKAMELVRPGSGSGIRGLRDPDSEFWLGPDSTNIDPKH